MSIIHEAFKKVQTGMSLRPKPAAETTTAQPKPATEFNAKSILVVICALIIMSACILYICQLFQNNINQAQNFAQRSFNTLIRKEHALNPQSKPVATLKPLAQVTLKDQAAPVTLDIHGIMANTMGNVVLINDQVYQEGDKVDGAKIVKINLDSIEIINNGIQQTIFVKN